MVVEVFVLHLHVALFTCYLPMVALISSEVWQTNITQRASSYDSMNGHLTAACSSHAEHMVSTTTQIKLPSFAWVLALKNTPKAPFIAPFQELAKGKDHHRSAYLCVPPPNDQLQQVSQCLVGWNTLKPTKLRQSCKFITRSSSWMISHHDERKSFCRKCFKNQIPQKKAAAQCSHVQALMCFSRLSAVQCFLHSLHCTSRLTSGNHSLPHSWNLQSRRYVASKHHPKTLYFCIFPGNLGSSKITELLAPSVEGTSSYGSSRTFPLVDGLKPNGATCWDGAVDVSPPKKRDSQIPNAQHLWINQQYDLVLSSFFWEKNFSGNFKSPHIENNTRHFATLRGDFLSGSYKNISCSLCWMLESKFTACESTWAWRFWRWWVSRITPFMFEGNSRFWICMRNVLLFCFKRFLD